MTKQELQECIKNSLQDEIESQILEATTKILNDQRNDAMKKFHNPLGGGHLETSGAGSAVDKSYRGMFPGATMSNGDFDSFGDFLKCIHDGRSDTRLVTKSPSGANQGIPTDGGFITPEEYAARIFDTAKEDEIIRPNATVYPMKSRTLVIPAMELTSHAISLYGNVNMAWVEEGGSVAGTKPAFRSMHLTAHKARIDVNVTNKLLQDSAPSFEQTLGKIFTDSMAFGLDSIFFTGHGAGQPLGVLNSPCLVTVDAETGQASGTICYENIIAMFSRLHPSCYRNAVWVSSITCIPQLMTLYLAIGTGGTAVPTLREESGKFFLLGKPIIFTEKLPTVGNKFDMLLADFSQYAIGIRSELRIEKSINPGWTTDESSWRCILRIDGQPLWDRPLTLKDGSTTVSPFVTLAAR